MRLFILALAAAMLALPNQAEPGPVVRVQFSNPGLTPSNWTLVIHPDGSGHFHADRGNDPAGPLEAMEPIAIDRDVQLSQAFSDRVFETARHHKFFNEQCESRLKVAFQGWKKISYTGPGGEGSCEFNYSRDKEIQSLGDSLVAVGSTLIEGARLQLLLQHDPLGLDKEMQYLLEGSGDGRLQQVCAIRGILERLEGDPDVMERVRKRARILLSQSAK
ncbi:MAG: hypothetical protein WAM85_19285 [Terracidiphilus sp.]